MFFYQPVKAQSSYKSKSFGVFLDVWKGRKEKFKGCAPAKPVFKGQKAKSESPGQMKDQVKDR